MASTSSLSRAKQKNPELNFIDDCTILAKENRLNAEFEIPNAASKLLFSADLMRKTVNISMKLDAPEDKSKATASINWLTRQLKNIDSSNITIRAYWPRRLPMTAAPLSEVLENPLILLHNGSKELPTYLEVLRVVDDARRFKGAKTFIEDATKEFTDFYKDVGQHLSKWVAKAPKVKEATPSPSLIPTIFSSFNEIISPDTTNESATIFSPTTINIINKE